MSISRNKIAAAALMALSAVIQLIPSASAQSFFANPYYSSNPYMGNYGGAPYYGGISSYDPYYRAPGVFTRHPIISSTVAGTAVGALGGAAIGATVGRGNKVGTGAAIGAGVGAAAGLGVGLIRNSRLKRAYQYGYFPY
ncbi:MAG: hypothetical protein K2W82_08270 [Candidatus Obscuribacterales bacterium]|nr:hypothetical protein [Candidatus Obscuribacterales bacterium]